MPNIIFKPKPMVDPYAGQAGEMIGELFSTISQISQLRKQRQQTNAILDIAGSNLSPEEKQKAFITVAQSGGAGADAFRNSLAGKLVSEAMVTDFERQKQQATIDWLKARAEAVKRDDGMLEYGRHQTAFNKAQEAKLEFEQNYTGDKKADKYKNQVTEFDSIMTHHAGMMENIRKQQGTSTIPSPITQTPGQVDAVTMASPLIGQQPVTIQAPAPVGPPLPPDYNRYVPIGVQAKWESMTPEERVATYSPQGQQKSQDELAGYFDKLDDESKQELQQILASGNNELIQKALARLKDKYRK